MIEKYALFKAIQKLITSPNNYSVRSLAKEANISVSTSKECLDYLLKKKILTLKKIGSTYQYNLYNNIITKQIKILFSLFQILDSNLIEELLEKYKYILSIILYGSVARGEDDSKSDIDILIISRKKNEILPLKAEKYVKREITFLVYTMLEWRQKSKTDKVFYDRIILDGIPLYGEIPMIK